MNTLIIMLLFFLKIMANNISFVFFLSFENCSPCLNRHCSCYTLATVQFGARLDSNEYLRISSSYVLKMVKTTLNECSYSNEPFHPPLTYNNSSLH